jgi:hypothetical protein
MKRPGPQGPGRRRKTMCKLVWRERLMGKTIIKKKTFPDRAERLKFILTLEKSRFFDKVLELS